MDADTNGRDLHAPPLKIPTKTVNSFCSYLVSANLRASLMKMGKLLSHPGHLRNPARDWLRGEVTH